MSELVIDKILKIHRDNKRMINDCANIYIKSFSEGPWNEKLIEKEVNKYIEQFINDNRNIGLALLHENNPIGFALIIIIPSYGGRYARIEDFCITPEIKSMGKGSHFLDLIKNYLLRESVDSIILNTIRDFPSHMFYKKNGFKEIEDSVTLFYET